MCIRIVQLKFNALKINIFPDLNEIGCILIFKTVYAYLFTRAGVSFICAPPIVPRQYAVRRSYITELFS